MAEFQWTKVRGEWLIRCVAGSASPGERVMVRKRSGTASAVILGDEVYPYTFRNATPKRGGRKARPAEFVPAPEDIEAGAAAHARDWDDFRD
jgi:hypothetical protein